MLVIRLSRTGRRNQAAYRVVVAEHSAPVQGKYVEIVGSYNPSENKNFTFDQARIEHWISVGAKPSDTVAALLKTNGMSGMDQYMAPRTKKKTTKNPKEEEAAPAAPAAAPEGEAPAEEAAPVEEAPETPVEEAPAEEPAPEVAEEPAKDEAAPAEETPAE